MKQLTICLLILLVSLSFSCKPEKVEPMDEEQQKEIYLEAIEKAQQQDYKAALNIIETKIQEIDRGFAYYYYYGVFIQIQDFSKYSSVALEYYLKAYELRPDSYKVNDAIGNAYKHIEEYDKAIPYLERAVELYTDGFDSYMADLYSDLADAYLHTGKLEEALEMNQKALEDFQYSDIYMRQGIILSELGDIEGLTVNYEKAKELEPDSLVIDREYGIQLIKVGELEKASDLYSTWLRGHEGYYGWCYADLGYIDMLRGDWKKSIEKLKMAEGINDQDSVTLEYLSYYYFFQKEYEEAHLYESKARLIYEPTGKTYRKRNMKEFLEGYKKNWQFQTLLERYGVETSDNYMIFGMDIEVSER